MARINDEQRAFSAEIGGRICQRRNALGLSQAALGEKLGVTFQQMQKYESGANRVSAPRLWDLAKHLGVPVGYFYGEAFVEVESYRKSATEALRGSLSQLITLRADLDDEIARRTAAIVRTSEGVTA